MIRHLLKRIDFSPVRATQLFLTFERHIITDEGAQRSREEIISRRFKLKLFWQHLKESHMTSGLSVAHVEEKKAWEACWWHKAITSFL